MLTGGDTLHSYPSVTFGFSLVNNYGPTENAVVATSGLVRDKDRKLGPPSIGRPISNSQVYLLDQHKRQVPVNVPGELCIGGDSLARGYLNDPALTAAKFIPSPFAHEPGARIYRTGDLARYRADGDIDFLGRTDHQVKVRGFRIELGEIEAALAQHPEVREAVVMSKGQVGDSRHLAAYFTPSRRGAVNTSQLRIFLKSKLPDYMVPVSYAMVEQFPLTSNGKVDRKALAGLNQDRAVRREAPVPPGTQMELNIISIFEEVLGTENIGIHDNFFDAGANSILIIRVVSKLREALDIKLSIIELFTYPTVSLLVNHLGRQQADQNKPFLNSILDRAALRRKALGW
jgi:acyl carrier protein